MPYALRARVPAPLWKAGGTAARAARALLWLTLSSACTTPKAVAPAPAAPSARVLPLSTSTAAPTDVDAGASAPRETAQAPEQLVRVSTKATRKTDGTWARCTSKAVSNGVDPGRELAAITTACEAATRMKLVGKPIVAKQSAADPPQSYPLQAQANHCYRVYAQAEAHIEILDVAIVDSDGVAAGQATTHGSTGVVLEDGAVCFEQADAASVVVSIGQGGGTYALQVWGDSPGVAP